MPAMRLIKREMGSAMPFWISPQNLRAAYETSSVSPSKTRLVRQVHIPQKRSLNAL